MTLTIDGSWTGWSGDTIVQMTDGSIWRQDEYHYAYRPRATITNGRIHVNGVSKAVRVRRR